MKILWCLLVTLLPLVTRGADVAMEPSPDWTPLEQSVMAALTKQAGQNGGRLVDASTFSGAGLGTVIIAPVHPAVNQQSVGRFVDGYAGGIVESTGVKVVKREVIKVATLPGVAVTFQGEANGQALSILAYLLFTRQEATMISVSRAGELTPTSPVMTSYLARLRIDPAAVPGEVNKPAGGSTIEIDRIPRMLGRVAGYALIVALLVWLVRKGWRSSGTRPTNPG